MTEDEHVVTNAHVVEGCDEPKVIWEAAAAAAAARARRISVLISWEG